MALLLTLGLIQIAGAFGASSRVVSGDQAKSAMAQTVSGSVLAKR